MFSRMKIDEYIEFKLCSILQTKNYGKKYSAQFTVKIFHAYLCVKCELLILVEFCTKQEGRSNIGESKQESVIKLTKLLLPYCLSVT